MDIAKLKGSVKCAGVSFKELDGHAVLCVCNSASEATVSLYGGHVMGWTPHGAQPVLWLSPAAKIEEGKSIRGGVPVCWPWFGPNPADSSSPVHGFARLSQWDFETAVSPSPAQTDISLIATGKSVPANFTSLEFKLRLRISVGADLSISLEVENNRAKELPFSAGLHTYFRVGDIGRVSVKGLEGASYFDKSDGQLKLQEDSILFNGKVDRIYQDVVSAHIVDNVFRRNILVENEGASSIVVWNPGEGIERQFPGFAKGDERNFVCVEAAQPELVRLPPGERRVLKTQISMK